MFQTGCALPCALVLHVLERHRPQHLLRHNPPLRGR